MKKNFGFSESFFRDVRSIRQNPAGFLGGVLKGLFEKLTPQFL